MGVLEKIKGSLFHRKKEQVEVLEQTPQKQPKPKKSTKPCIYKGLGGSFRLEKYEPALRELGVSIPLASPEPISFPLSEEKIAELKAGLRYVWCDGFESAEWQPRDCKYLGIRITDSFVLHETVMYEWNEWLNQWLRKCRSREITVDELRLVVAVWDQINAMRIQAEDLPLPDEDRFWVQTQDYYNADKEGNLHFHDSEDYALLLMAVTNN